MFSSFHLQSDNENTVLGRLAFPGLDRGWHLLSLLPLNCFTEMIFVSDFSVSSLTHTNKRPRGGGNGSGWGGRNRIPWMASAGGLGCGPLVSMKCRLRTLGLPASPLCFSARHQGHTFHRAKPKVKGGKMARNLGLVDFQKLTSSLCGSVCVPWGCLCQKDVSEEDVSSKQTIESLTSPPSLSFQPT